MKKSIFTLLAFLLFSVFLFAQSSQQASSKPVAATDPHANKLTSKTQPIRPASVPVAHNATYKAVQNSDKLASATHGNVPASTVTPKTNPK